MATTLLTTPDTATDVVHDGKTIGTVHCINVARSSEAPVIKWYGKSGNSSATGQAHASQAQAEADVIAWANGENVSYPKHAELRAVPAEAALA
jgi:hypothetical protein